jgi:hypothetical protein
MSKLDFETAVREAIADLPEELTGYAARAAVVELSDNWNSALRDGAKPADLVSDVDSLVSHLNTLRARITP